MTYTMKIAAAALTGLLSLSSIAQAQETKPETGDMPMAEGHSMNGDMSDMKNMEGMKGMDGMKGMEGMMPMMKMMSEMGPMMEACTEMMQTMNDHMTSAHSEDQKG